MISRLTVDPGKYAPKVNDPRTNFNRPYRRVDIGRPGQNGSAGAESRNVTAAKASDAREFSTDIKGRARGLDDTHWPVRRRIERRIHAIVGIDMNQIVPDDSPCVFESPAKV